MSKLKPDQVILFGSAARNEMHAGSDLDLLVVTAPGTPTEHPRHKKWQYGETENDEVDVLVMARDEVERGRHSITLVQGAALDEGRTVYARPGVRPVQTGPEYVWNGRETVKKTLFDPDEATRLLDRAEIRWRYANEDYSGPIEETAADTRGHALSADPRRQQGSRLAGSHPPHGDRGAALRVPACADGRGRACTAPPR